MPPAKKNPPNEPEDPAVQEPAVTTEGDQLGAGEPAVTAKAPRAGTGVLLRYVGPSGRLQDTPTTGLVFDRDGEPVRVTKEDAERLQSIPGENFEIVSED